MIVYSKHLYRISEVADMLGLPVTTISYWTNTFDEIQPVAVGTGRQRKYRPEDIEAIKLVRHLMRDRQMQIEGAKLQLKRAKAPQRGFKCESAEDALALISDAGKMASDSPRVQAMLAAVQRWIEAMQPENPRAIRAEYDETQTQPAKIQ